MPRWKRAVDLICSLAALPLLALLTLWIAMVMRLTSPGPVLFRQERVSGRGRRFWAYRFRTMHVGPDRNGSAARSGDPIRFRAWRANAKAAGGAWFIPGGRLMRATRLDELPQILNVLRGEMSLVGPRPGAPAARQSCQPERHGPLNAVPGLTGLWQVVGGVHGRRRELTRLDSFYIRKKSFWLDLKIMLLTVPALLRRVRDARDADSSSTRSGTSARVGA